MTSDGLWYPSGERTRKGLATLQDVAELRPRTGFPAAGDHMSHTRGRPPAYESERRRRHFAELVAADLSHGTDADFRLAAHARTAGVKPERALRLLSQPSFRDLVETIADSLEAAA